MIQEGSHAKNIEILVEFEDIVKILKVSKNRFGNEN
jgi:hypothetical protein